MKYQKFFVGTTLTLLGLFYLATMFELVNQESFPTGITTVTIFGIGFLVQAAKGRQPDLYLPGTIMSGVGISYFLENLFSNWPNALGSVVVITGLSLIFHSFKKGGSVVLGLITTLVGICIVFQERFYFISDIFNKSADILNTFWPLIIIGVGLYALLRKN